MRQFLRCLLIVACAFVGFSAARPAHADTLASAAAPGLCLDWNNSTNKVALYTCQDSWNQSFFTTAYGQQGAQGKCLDGSAAGADLVMTPCANKPSQRWSLVSDNTAPGALRNEAGYCADVFGGNAVSGQRIIAYTCKWGVDLTRRNQVWTRGVQANVSQIVASTGLPIAILQRLQQGTVFSPGGVILNGANLGKTLTHDGAAIVAQGGGNIVAQGGGNIVAQGGGNIVAQGGGNFTRVSGGGIIAR